MNTLNFENRIATTKNILINLSNVNNASGDLQYLVDNFCGTVVKNMLEIPNNNSELRIYAIGDIKQIEKEERRILVISDFSINYEGLIKANFKIIKLGQVPINIHNSGVYYRELFTGENYFSKIKTEHTFQYLTEGNKDSKALRKGIYLTKVVKEEKEDKEEQFHFRLLRCSTNLTGPTDNFRNTDIAIVNTLNEAVKFDFEKETELNHVLAQIYENKKKDEVNVKDVKAKIGAHSDKTKDMPKEGLIAFCTFYDNVNFENLEPSKTDRFDWCYKKSSGLTRLHFKLKKTVSNDSLEKEFSVTLYPNSVFLIPLSTNRLYTHEIRPSVLNVDKIPVRMGYVIRCSNLEALYVNKETYIKEKGKLVKLEEMTNVTMANLRDSYYKENKLETVVDYGKVHFSMNSGDYKKPIY